MYLMMCFYNLSFNPANWSDIARYLFVTEGIIFSAGITFFSFLFKEDKEEVIVRDPKTGRFKKK